MCKINNLKKDIDCTITWLKENLHLPKIQLKKMKRKKMSPDWQPNETKNKNNNHTHYDRRKN